MPADPTSDGRVIVWNRGEPRKIPWPFGRRAADGGIEGAGEPPWKPSEERWGAAKKNPGCEVAVSRAWTCER